MINVYLYQKNIKLLNNSYKKMDDKTMFNDKVILYQGVDNTISFKIRNQDRVTQTPQNVIFNIVRADNKLLVSQLYLELIETDKFYKIKIDKNMVDDLADSANYLYFLTFNENNIENVLYTDHNYNAHGSLEVRKLFIEPTLEIIEFGDNMISNEFLLVDEYTTEVVFHEENHTISTTLITIEKSTEKTITYDTSDDSLWKPFMTIVPSNNNTVLRLPFGRYRIKIDSSKYGKSIHKSSIK